MDMGDLGFFNKNDSKTVKKNPFRLHSSCSHSVLKINNESLGIKCSYQGDNLLSLFHFYTEILIINISTEEI